MIYLNYPFADIDVGQYFEVKLQNTDAKDMDDLRQRMYFYIRHYKLHVNRFSDTFIDLSFKVNKINENTFRIWRIR